jgi:hypothetical protein
MENSMRLKELSEELHTNINELLSGNMSPEQTQHLVELCSELYEKLIVLRFKAFSESSTPAEKMQAVLENVEPIKIDTTPSPTPIELVKQVNLIDAIKEVEQDVAQEPSQEEEIEEEDGDDEEIVFQLIPNDEPVAETPDMTVVPETAIEEAPAREEVKPMVSLNDRFKENANQQATIAKKSEESPIDDLKKNISLNQRFQFCKDLFKGNNQEYEVTLEKLNNTNRDEAIRVLQTLKEKYNWNPDSMAVRDFTDLVTRRYMA